ncbi:MAG: RIP metalloprotease RseP [Gammaproteobacteria bacterium]|nr:RIP metalloprotease RseP [Gammaproteobacteria bacterium]
MISVLYTIISFIVAISILIAFHEFGHYWVAKRLGVKVLRFSIGFGKPIWRKVAGADKTEYVIAALPLGGYVKMLDEREGDVPEDERHRAFNRQPIWKRFSIVFAGPAFNILLAILAYLSVALVGTSGLKPVIGLVMPGSPAAVAGLESGMQIVSVDGWSTPTWDTVFQEALPNLVEKSELRVKAKFENGIEHDYELNLSGLNLDKDIQQPFKAMGIRLFNLPPVIGKVADGTPAEKAGLKPGDRIIQIDNQPILDWMDISDYVLSRPGQEMKVLVKRDNEEMSFNVRAASKKIRGREIGQLGIGGNAFKLDDKDRAEFKLGVFDGIAYSIHRTWDVAYVTLRVLGLIATTKMSLTNISGPINIAVTAGESASLGLDRYIIFLALVSISLGILNLLPIPILDGGHLMYYVYEFVRGKPVSEKVEIIGQRIGIALLMMLMALAFYNDIMRYFH